MTMYSTRATCGTGRRGAPRGCPRLKAEEDIVALLAQEPAELGLDLVLQLGVVGDGQGAAEEADGWRRGSPARLRSSSGAAEGLPADVGVVAAQLRRVRQHLRAGQLPLGLLGRIGEVGAGRDEGHELLAATIRN